MRSIVVTLLRPSNAVCDMMKIEDEHERGMIRMLVNMLILTAVGCVALGLGLAAML